LKDRGLTAIVTGERGREGQLTRFGIEEYVSDCVIVLDHRVSDDISTRRLRVAKYRGSVHGTNEYPFLITDRGFTVLPITSVGLAYGASSERVSTGMAQLDRMLGGGVHRGSTVMVTGGAGTGKTTLAAQVVDAACARGERALFISFEESPDQLVRNMESRSASTSASGWRRGCCRCGPSGQPPRGWSPIWDAWKGCWMRPRPQSWHWTRWRAWAMWVRPVRCCRW
jgi:circadian clock protein KaiC